MSLGRSADGNFTLGASVEGSYSNYEKEGIARATIGEGEIVVRDGDADGVSATKLRAEADSAEAAGDADTAATLRAMADAEEAEDTAATDTQLANLNRDPDNVVEVTKVVDEGFELYVSDTSVRTAVEAVDVVGQALGKAFAQVSEALTKSGELTAEELATAQAVGEAIDEGRFDLQALANCSGKQGFNLWHLFVSPAYASTGCVLVDKNGAKIADLTPKEREVCVKLLANLLEKYADEYLGDPATAGKMPESVRAIANSLRSIAPDEQAIQLLNSFGMAGGLIREYALSALLEEHDSEAYNDLLEFFKELAGYGQVGGDAVDTAIDRVADKHGLSEADRKDLKLVSGAGLAVVIGLSGGRYVVKNGIATQTKLLSGKTLDIEVSEARINHVLHGDVRASGPTGGHSTNSGSVKTIGNVEVGHGGVRRAQVAIHGQAKSNNGGVSTLFPASWSDQRILREFSQGLRTGVTSSNPITGVPRVVSPSGVTIEFIRRGGEIKTFYPVFE
ncbi:hypothetical protein TRICHSKD4_5789 [Roseibium sp. TrichSKD4]|uniref:EndoU domain-containing protein n=1 Tax=Roseibium sp. TrichSKD4 TaxID=744980 RepID=UPI0001E57507|nr:EndoU domain-containing protein [Roseibium sp. TrichSKD4]EFO29948.1 hypothetical protein TRICHSKD4_5789 [Roseibium sp. TrichSKD4]